MAKGDPVVSPYVYDSGGDAHGKHIKISVNFDNVTRIISGAVIVRDNGCLYAKIYIGLGADGTPNTTTKVFSVPFGTTNITKAQINNFGINTIEDFFNFEITAGP